MSFSHIFIARPVATTLLTFGLALAGAMGFLFLPVAPLPQVDFPTIQVTAALPGASPETIASSVAAPLERQFGRIAGVTDMTSTSYLGATTIVLQFELGRSIDGAARDVQAAINAARGYLPPELPANPAYRKVNPADAPIMILALNSDTYSTGRMYDLAASILQQRLAQVEGIGQVFAGGGSLPAVRVELNPAALNQYGIATADVRQALSRTNISRPKGQLTRGERTWEIETNDQLRAAEQFRPVIVAYHDGAPIRIADVADVHDSVEDVRAAAVTNEKPAVLLVMFRAPNANIIDTVDRVYDILPELKASLPAAVSLSVVLDRTPPIRASLHDVEITLVIATLLVILVVFAFLRNVRATLIPTVAVPVSLIGTFGVMYLCDYSLNNLSLMALTIATGFVVDDAIVVLENITRYLDAGMSRREAALRGAREIGFTVLSMSASLVAVFIPVLLMGGMIGRLFREFAVTLSAAITISLVVSLTTTPMMCATLLRRSGGTHGPLFRASERAFDWLLDTYRRSLSRALAHPRLMLAITLGTIGLNVYLFSIVPKGFFPQQDIGRLTGTIQAAQDISFQAMQEKLRDVVTVLRGDPDVHTVIGFTGGGGGGGGSARNTARLFVGLTPPNERDLTADQVIGRLRPKLATVPGAPTFLQPIQDIRIGGRAGIAQYQYTLQGESVDDLERWAPQLVQRLRGVREVLDVTSDQQNQGLQVSLRIDRDTASRLGVTPQQIDDALYDAFGQRQVAISYTPLNQYHVVMEVAPQYWQQPETLRQLYVRSTTGAMVPLSAFASYTPASTTLAVNHQGQFPAVTISFNLAPGVALSEAVAAVEAAARQLGMPATIRGSFQGTAQAFQDALANQPLLILAALVTVYIVLGVLYESYIHPITILSTLPSAGVGAIIALLVCGMDLSVIALIGILLLIGIVKKNAIMMIDFAVESERRDGKEPEDAIFEACLLRFRPIMMTTMAAALGALPLAIGQGIGSELRRPLGVAIVGGLLVSQALTLYTTPVVYLYLDRLRLWLLRARKRMRPAVGQEVSAVLALGFLLALLAGCAVGPDYVRPSAPMSDAFKEVGDWKIAQPGDDRLRGAWWEMFGDAQLNALAEQIDGGSYDLAAAEARFRQAQALIGAARASYFPTATIGITAARVRQSGNLSTNRGATGGTFSNYSLPLEVAWEADLWGRIRRTVESSRATADATQADLASIRLSLQTQLASNYFQLRALDAERALLDATAAAYETSLTLTQNRYRAGVVSRADVAQAVTQVESTRAQSLDVAAQRAQLEHAIAVLVGTPPAMFSIAPAPLTGTPPEIPLAMPSLLLERRPDVSAAARRVAAANAEIGVADAAYYPAITLSASGGFESSELATWFTWPSRFWSVGPAISQTVYDGGLRKARSENAHAVYDETVAVYRNSVLAAFQEVEDNLAALRILEEEARVQALAVDAGRESVALTTNQYKGGTVSYLAVVVAQTLSLANERAAVDVLNRRMLASVRLIKALGGGWSETEIAANP